MLCLVAPPSIYFEFHYFIYVIFGNVVVSIFQNNFYLKLYQYIKTIQNIIKLI